MVLIKMGLNILNSFKVCFKFSRKSVKMRNYLGKLLNFQVNGRLLSLIDKIHI